MVRASQPNHHPTDDYDSLSEQDQAVMRQSWAARAASLREALDYESAFRSAGESYSEGDEDGTVIAH